MEIGVEIFDWSRGQTCKVRPTQWFKTSPGMYTADPGFEVQKVLNFLKKKKMFYTQYPHRYLHDIDKDLKHFYDNDK